MSRWAENLVLILNRLFPQMAMHRTLHTAKLDEVAYQAWEYEEARSIYRDFGPEWQPAGQRILDIGCGLGGKLVFYAESGARQVIGIDLRSMSARAARDLAIRQGVGQFTSVVVADAARLPFASQSFDAVVSVNVMEHVEDPVAVLEACGRVLRRQGLAFLHFPPYLSPWGAHLEGWIHFPWPHLLFSEKTLLRALRRIEQARRLDEQYIAQAQVPWSDLSAFQELNKLSLSRFRALLHDAGWSEMRCQLLPFGYQFLRNRGQAGRLALALLQALSALPGLREILTTKMVFVLRREAPLR